MENAKGTRDVSGEDAILRQRIVATLKSVFELYGFNPLETPVLERFETLASKYAGGEEILKEVFKLRDQGSRELALRYDLTVPLARFIAMNSNLKMPFKRYAIGSVFRDGPMKTGRYREFTQCDVDAIGSAGMAADAEMIKIALTVFEKLGLKIAVKVNNRKVLDAIMEKAGVEKEKAETVILSIDKLEKLGKEAVEKELAGKGIGVIAIAKVMQMIASEGNNKDRISNLKKALGENKGLAEIQEVLRLAGGKGVIFEPSLARGLAYYTGTVFEAYMTNSEIKSSVAAGGRYDEMIGKFVQNGRQYPAVGISFGLDVIIDAIRLQRKSSEKSVVKAYLISIGEDKKTAALAESLRKECISCDADYTGKAGKAVEYANYYEIPYVIFLGKKETKAGKIKLRDMRSGKEKLIALKSAIKMLKSEVGD